MTLPVRLSDSAAKALDRVDRILSERLRKRLHQLAESPFDPRLSKTLTGVPGMRSSRVGSWRILFSLGGSGGELHVVAIRPRGTAYRDL